MSERFDLVVVGGGAIGLACAWRAAQRGLRVCVLDAGERGNASHAAAGMLAPASELGETVRALTELSRQSFALYPEFVAELEEEAAGADCAFRVCGSLQVAFDVEQRTDLAHLYALQQEEGLATEWLDADACRDREPGLGRIDAGLWSPAEGQVDPRALVEALRLACARRGVRLEQHAAVTRAQIAGDRLVAVATERERFSAEQVLLAAGAHSGDQRWLPAAHCPPVTPVKGELLRGRLADAPATALVRGGHAYVVPRPDGRVVVGASSEHAGFDDTPTPAIRDHLLEEGKRLLPALAELTELEHSVGFRPATPDGLPLVGETELDGLLLATGHYRNGILLAPITAAGIAALLVGEPHPPSLAAAAPRRFVSVER